MARTLSSVTSNRTSRANGSSTEPWGGHCGSDGVIERDPGFPNQITLTRGG